MPNSPADKKAPRALLACLLLTLPAVAGCLSGASDDLLVVASAPKQAGGLTIFIVVHGALAKLRGDQATYEILYGEEPVYPPGGVGKTIELSRGKGSVFVPYNLFVIGNGDYDILVKYGGKESRVRASVEKWVNYVYLHPYDRGSAIVVDAQLSRAQGGLPSARVTTEGELQLDLYYRGRDGAAKTFLSRIALQTQATDTFARVEIPRGKFSEGPGYYSLEATFHNAQAKNNVNVGNDPAMAQRNPPWNWIYLSR